MAPRTLSPLCCVGCFRWYRDRCRVTRSSGLSELRWLEEQPPPRSFMPTRTTRAAINHWKPDMSWSHRKDSPRDSRPCRFIRNTSGVKEHWSGRVFG